MGEEIARAIAEGYKDKHEPYHGYYFKILKGQGPAAPMGQMDFVVDSAMIGGFALVAAPAEYLVTGVNTFIVSHDGIVYEKDLGDRTLEAVPHDGALQPRLHLESGPRLLSPGPSRSATRRRVRRRRRSERRRPLPSDDPLDGGTRRDPIRRGVEAVHHCDALHWYR